MLSRIFFQNVLYMPLLLQNTPYPNTLTFVTQMDHGNKVFLLQSVA